MNGLVWSLQFSAGWSMLFVPQFGLISHSQTSVLSNKGNLRDVKLETAVRLAEFGIRASESFMLGILPNLCEIYTTELWLREMNRGVLLRGEQSMTGTLLWVQL